MAVSLNTEILSHASNALNQGLKYAREVYCLIKLVDAFLGKNM